jgi:hypothetical protein
VWRATPRSVGRDFSLGSEGPRPARVRASSGVSPLHIASGRQWAHGKCWCVGRRSRTFRMSLTRTGSSSFSMFAMLAGFRPSEPLPESSPDCCGKLARKAQQSAMVLYFTARSSKERHKQIFMGRDKVENEELIKYGLPEDIWCAPAHASPR